MMNSESIQADIYAWAKDRSWLFTAPYGILTGESSTASALRPGRKFRSVTFGIARTLDATVEIFNKNFILIKVSYRPTMKSTGDKIIADLTEQFLIPAP